MKTYLFRKIFFALFLLAGAISQAQAALIASHFSDPGNNQWTVDLALSNDSDAAGINEFTVYFSELSFSNLSVVASPASWDSFVAQPDLALASPGFFDSFNPQALALGGTQAGFTIGFTFLGQGAPGALAFDIVGSDFLPTSSGTSTLVTAPIPEPATAWLMLAGAMMLGRKRTSHKGMAV